MPCADFPFVFSAVVHGSLHMSSGSAGSLVSVPSAVNHLSAEKNACSLLDLVQTAAGLYGQQSYRITRSLLQYAYIMA